MLVQPTPKQRMYDLLGQLVEGKLSVHRFSMAMDDVFYELIDLDDRDEVEKEALGAVGGAAVCYFDEHAEDWGRTPEELSALVLSTVRDAVGLLESTGHWKRQVSARDAVRRAILGDWDPHGINEYEEAAAEYEPLTEPVFLLLDRGAPLEEIYSRLVKIEEVHLGIACDKTATREFAESLVRLRASRPFALQPAQSPWERPGSRPASVRLEQPTPREMPQPPHVQGIPVPPYSPPGPFERVIIMVIHLLCLAATSVIVWAVLIAPEVSIRGELSWTGGTIAGLAAIWVGYLIVNKTAMNGGTNFWLEPVEPVAKETDESSKIEPWY